MALALDEVYLVETLSDLWFGHLLIDEERYWPVGAGRTMECAESELVDLSGAVEVGGGSAQRP